MPMKIYIQYLYPKIWGEIRRFFWIFFTNIAPVPKRISKVASFSTTFSGWGAILVWEEGITCISVDSKAHNHLSLVIGHLETRRNSLSFTVINTWLHGGILKIDIFHQLWVVDTQIMWKIPLGGTLKT